ncbi:MAG: hypothetical protein JSR21_02200, partial [Proteobacteria bacterium]|nr:hypothetical protein [Pseudomonadota bacterium]
MSVIEPFGPHAPDRSPGMAPQPAGAVAAFRPLVRLTSLVAVAVAALIVLSAPPPIMPAAKTPLLPLTAGALLLTLGGLAGATVMAWARRRAAATPDRPADGRAVDALRRVLRLPPRGDVTVIGSAAGWPQAFIVGLSAIGSNWLLLAAHQTQGAADNAAVALGVAAIVLCFPLLVAERHFATVPEARLPEAAGLHALFLLCVLVVTGGGIVQIAIGLGIPHAPLAMIPLAILVGGVATELALRSVGRCFMPPPRAADARAAVTSLLASMIAEGIRGRSIAAPVRRHLGIDISRSWAMSYMRASAPHVILLLLLVLWGLTGVVLVGTDQRAIYERFGAPIAVLHSGLHVVLPWPVGRVRHVEFGTIQQTTLSDTDFAPTAPLVGAEDRAPLEADRLWEERHPSELTFLIASKAPVAGSSTERQSFQVVSADVRLLYRIGLTDADAMQAAYRTNDPEALLRGVAGRVLSRFFAGRTLDDVLGDNRDMLAERLRASVQQELVRARCGIELVALVIEAIHPPGGAAEAYHAVQAAEIKATTSIAAERGRAIADLSKAKQYATELVSQAKAAAAEAVSAAQIDLTRFTADRAAARAGGAAFIVNRRLTDLAHALSREQLVIVDHRIPAASIPFLDLRPPAPAASASARASRADMVRPKAPE